MSVYRAPAPRSTEALERIGRLLAEDIQADVSVSDERLVIRGPRASGSTIGCAVVAAALCLLTIVMLSFFQPGWAGVARVVVAVLGLVLGVVAVFAASRPRLAIDLRAGRARQRQLGLTHRSSLDRVLGVSIERSFERGVARSGEIAIHLSTSDGPLEVLSAHELRAVACSRGKAFSVALAAWLGVSLEERSAPATRSALRETDARLALDVSGIEEIAAEPSTKTPRARDEVDAADVVVLVIRLFDAL